VMVYRDELFGPQYTGNVFVEDSVYNVVHRMILRPEGFTFRGERGPDEQRSEFLGSADPWFRPATLRTGPDGALWITDMHRFVIEHPEWIVPELTNQLELRRHSDKGRIYRVYPVDKKPRPIPRLDKLDMSGLVAALDSPNGWQRDMAQQMLIWRADEAAVPLLEKMVAGSSRALARLHALCTLDGPAAGGIGLRDVVLQGFGIVFIERRIQLQLQAAAGAKRAVVGLPDLAGDVDRQRKRHEKSLLSGCMSYRENHRSFRDRSAPD